MTKQKKQNWKVLLTKRKGFVVVADTLLQAKDKAMFIIMFQNEFMDKSIQYRGIEKC